MSGLDPLTCRACLVTDVKLFNLHQIGLAELFGYLSKTVVSPCDGLPQYVCFYCRTQLRKFNDFQYKCQQSLIYFKENALRGPSGFCTPLTKTRNLILDYVPEAIIVNDNLIYETKVDSLNDNFNESNNVKDELDDLIDFNDDDDDDRKNDEKSLLYDNYYNENNVTLDQEVIVKSEIVDETDIIAEPLKELKNEKDVFIDKNKVEDCLIAKKKKSKKKTDIKSKRKAEKKPKEKCNKYNEKFEKDFEEFSKIHNVKVVCLSKDEQIRRVQERKESKEYRDSRFSCDVCYKGFMSETAHKRHMKSHDPGSGEYICEVCHMRYPTQRNLNTHARQHKKIFVCALCDQVNVDTTRAKLHSRWHKGVKFTCKTCHKEFNANTTYLSHVREVHKPVSCTHCGQTLLGTHALQTHTRIHKQNKCEGCAVVFHNAEALERHRGDGQCHGNNSLRLRPCLLCGENFSCRSSLSEHMKQRHSGNGDTFTCELCRSVFTSDRSLGAHFAAAHYALKPRASKPAEHKQYLCELCAKAFPTALRLKLHHQFHSDERPFKCSICPKLLKTKAGLEFHMNTHTGHRPYKCRVCPETFKSHAHRHNHQIMKHTTRERRHKCSSCDKCFVTASDLRKHVRYVHLRHPRPHQAKPGGRAKQTND